MSIEIARDLFESARGHALSGNLLYNAALAKAEDEGQPDPAQWAFSGPYSISIHYLIGLSLELLLKTAYVLHGGGRQIVAGTWPQAGRNAQHRRGIGLSFPSAQPSRDRRLSERAVCTAPFPLLPARANAAAGRARCVCGVPSSDRRTAPAGLSCMTTPARAAHQTGLHRQLPPN